jgi:hypothetical protein
MRIDIKTQSFSNRAGKLVEVLPVSMFPFGIISAKNGLAFMPANSIESRAYKNTFTRKKVQTGLKHVQ